MNGDVKHHLMLREEEVKLVLQALEQYEPRDLRCAVPKGRCEQLARMIQQGCGITLDPYGEVEGGRMAADRPSEKPSVTVDSDHQVSTDGGPTDGD
jgi:hypothetical protein